MKLDECLPALPAAAEVSLGWAKIIRDYGLACARAGALAALDEAIPLLADETLNRYEIADRIRRLRDAIAKGESE